MVNSEIEKQQILEQLSAYIAENAPKQLTANLKKFAIKFYNTIAAGDLSEKSIPQLYAMSLSMWNFISNRESEQCKIRAYNPTQEDHGWECIHSVVEVSQPDMPFLVDSIRMEINRLGMLVHLIIHTGCFHFIRDESGKLIGIKDEPTEKTNSEAVIYVEVDRQVEPVVFDCIIQNVSRVLEDVRCAVDDWGKMSACVEECLVNLESNCKGLDPEEVDESRDFLRWLLNEHFTFLGSRDYTLEGKGKKQALQLVKDTGLGVLKEDINSQFSKSLADLPPRVRAMMLSSQILIIAKTNTVSTVHRTAYTDYIGVKKFDDKGQVIGIRLIIGLYTSSAYNSNPKYIPFLRHKVSQAVKRSKLAENGHAGKALLNILETLPRDDLFQASTDELFELSMGILHLQERQRTRVFIRKDSYNRYFSCLVFVPRENFNTELRKKIQAILMQALGGIDSTFSTSFTDSILARVHFVIRVNPKDDFDYDVDIIQESIIAITRSWRDELKESLVDHFGEAQGVTYFNSFRDAFSASYKESYSTRIAIEDIEHINRLSDDNTVEIKFSQTSEEVRNKFYLKIFRSQESTPLSDVLPILENLGLRVLSEQPSVVSMPQKAKVWIDDFELVQIEKRAIDIDAVQDNFKSAFIRIWFGEVENDAFNRLILEASLSWKETSVLRGLSRYLQQIGFTFSQGYIASALYRYPMIASKLITLFYARFSPENEPSSKEQTAIVDAIKFDLDSVASLDQDKILRKLLALVKATTRTNYFQLDGGGLEKTYISFKFDPSLIPDIPLPKPMFEIFVYSPSIEGVHLRGAKVARGGLRWSDRREDYRTEILGLMKAQQVKNSVIVPLGAKGGFICKKLPVNGTREEVMTEVICSYQSFIRGLLDVTDNFIDGKVIPPKNVVRYDADDYYLVVAADKGTATFSDIANAISDEYKFWLGDAFASGGSTGYDHKKMGITARGAWVSTMRHFRELGLNTQTMDFTAIAIGDMAGDVFGNGMLMSEHIKLVAAFNHMHIFLDPDPDPAKSILERKRLFELPRSTWDDYDRAYLSKGGAIFSRSDKVIHLTPEIKFVLRLKVDEIAPNDLIKAILRAKVDLFWNGGIGTYVKASDETHLDVGDKANDGVRINAKELRCRVVAEGGNLGLTQKARIECSQHGVRVNTDFIDNSAGVDCSDHEVNIKILLNSVMDAGELTEPQRNQLLSDMTDEVAELVLHNNYLQTETLSLEEHFANETMDMYRGYIAGLEKQGLLNRELEFLPSEAEIKTRRSQGLGLTRPEISVLIAYDKNLLKQKILESELPEDPYFLSMLFSAFPKSLCEKYSLQMESHILRREIIATQLSNMVTNLMGINFVARLQKETGASIARIVRAFIAAYGMLGLAKEWRAVRDLDYRIDTNIQFELTLQLYFLVRRSTRWLLKNTAHEFDIQATIDRYKNFVVQLFDNLLDLLTKEQKKKYKQRKKEYTSKSVPEALACKVARCRHMYHTLDLIEAASEAGASLLEVASLYFTLSSKLSLGWLRYEMISHPIESQWDELARSSLLDDLDYHQRLLTLKVFSHKKPTQSNDSAFLSWTRKNKAQYDHWSSNIFDMRSTENAGFIMYSVVINELADMANG